MKLYRLLFAPLIAATVFLGCSGVVSINAEDGGDTDPEEEQTEDPGEKEDEPEAVVQHYATLSVSEFGDKIATYAAGYDSEKQYANEAGTWIVCAFNYLSKALQINKDKVAYIGTPLFDGRITEVSLSFEESFSGDIFLCGKAGSKTAEDILVTSSAKSCKDISVDASSVSRSQFFIRSSACARITSVSITYVTGGGEGTGGGNEGTDGDGDEDRPEGGEGGEQQQDTIPGYGVGFSRLYEVPAVATALPDGQAYSNVITESKDNGDGRKAFVCNMSTNDQILVTHTYVYDNRMYRNYTMLFDKKHAAALWEAYVLHKTSYPDKNVGRTGNWVYDPAIPEDWQTAGCEGSYHKGHQVPSNDRQACKAANRQTFYYSNQTPQWQTRFNDGIWNTLEQRVNGAAPSGSDTLYVVTGPLYEDSTTITDETGKTVPLPSGYYKCVMKCSFSNGTLTDAKGAGYIFPRNEAYSSTSYGSFACTIDEVETRTGFDFFANMPGSIQEKAESKIMFSL